MYKQKVYRPVYERFAMFGLEMSLNVLSQREGMLISNGQKLKTIKRCAIKIIT